MNNRGHNNYVKQANLSGIAQSTREKFCIFRLLPQISTLHRIQAPDFLAVSKAISEQVKSISNNRYNLYDAEKRESP